MPTLASNTTVLNAVQNELRIPVTNTTERAKIQQTVSGVYGDMCAKADWWWLQRHAVINTGPKITAGTVAVQQDGNTIVFSTTPLQFGLPVTVAGRVLRVTGNTDAQAAYGITTHIAGGTAAFLDGNYTGTTDAAAGYTVSALSYILPAACAKLLSVRCFGFPQPLERMGIEDLSALQTWDTSEGKPRALRK